MTKIIQDVNLGKNLKKLRKNQGLTQENICAKLTLAGRPMLQSTYAQIETGRRNIFASDLIVLARILNTDFNEIFEGLEAVNKYDLEKADESNSNFFEIK
jgi:transcriptional regulator with XRE-family HTH domain